MSGLADFSGKMMVMWVGGGLRGGGGGRADNENTKYFCYSRLGMSPTVIWCVITAASGVGWLGCVWGGVNLLFAIFMYGVIDNVAVLFLIASVHDTARKSGWYNVTHLNSLFCVFLLYW